jgi:hypothetical protein
MIYLYYFYVFTYDDNLLLATYTYPKQSSSHQSSVGFVLLNLLIFGVVFRGSMHFLCLFFAVVMSVLRFTACNYRLASSNLFFQNGSLSNFFNWCFCNSLRDITFSVFPFSSNLLRKIQHPCIFCCLLATKF